MSVTDLLLVDGVTRGQFSAPHEDRGENARTARRNVEHDEHGSSEIPRQLRDDLTESFDAARRCADDDDVVPAPIGLSRHAPPNPGPT